jgi:hypothetical protein
MDPICKFRVRQAGEERHAFLQVALDDFQKIEL